MKKIYKKFLIAIIVLLALTFGAFKFYDNFIPRDISKISLEDLDEKKSKLTKDDYVKDFDFLYETLKNYYPFFEINKRQNDIDWLANRDIYRKYISESINDQDFFFKCNEILMDLNNGHTHLVDESSGLHMFLVYYQLPKGDWRSDIANNYLIDNVRRRYNITSENIGNFVSQYYGDDYGKDLPMSINYSKDSSSQSLFSSQDQNLQTLKLIDKKLAYIRVRSMLPPNLRKEDEKRLPSFLKQVENYPNLIIDIRGNTGGDSSYWQKFLLPKIIGTSYTDEEYFFIKDGDLLKRVREQEGYQKLDDKLLSEFSKENQEILKDFSYGVKASTRVSPSSDSINYKGKIYLLVDKNVYSSSESMSIFLKDTKLATLVGQRTRGDGIGTDPYQINLPNTGYMLRFSKQLGITNSGSINELDHTQPDIEIDASDSLLLENQEIIKFIMSNAS